VTSLSSKIIEAVLRRLNQLTLDENKTGGMLTLAVVYGLVQNMGVVMDGEKGPG
jgi:hypothetical protein